MKRVNGYHRYQKNRAINRKFNIVKRTWGSEDAENFYGGKRKGQLAKGKIHCSCPMCSRKSYMELKHSDMKKLIAYYQALNDNEQN